MYACSNNDLVNSQFLYNIPKHNQKLPHTLVLIQPTETGCHHCISEIKRNLNLLEKQYYVIMPKSPLNTERIDCYQPDIHEYTKWNPEYFYPTEFVIDSNMTVVMLRTYNTQELVELIDKLKR